MDLTPTESERALREECRAWLRENLPWEYGKGLPPRFDDLADEVAFGREWQAKLASGRWVGGAWPTEYGGGGAGAGGHHPPGPGAGGGPPPRAARRPPGHPPRPPLLPP